MIATSVCVAADPPSATNAAERFKAEAPVQWASLFDSMCKNLELHWTVQFGAPNATPAGVDINVRGGEISHLCRLLEPNQLVFTTYRTGKKKGAERVEVVNGDYGFAVNRQTSDQPWLLKNMDRDPSVLKNHGVLLGTTPIFAGLMIEGGWLDKVVASSGFEVLSAEVANAGAPNEECKVIFKSNFAIDPNNSIMGGTFWFASRKYWVLNRYEIDEKSLSLGKVSGEMEYQDLNDLPIPKRWINTFRFEDQTRYVYNYEPATKFTGSTSDFRLTAYGLPEPATTAPRGPISFWIWINLLAVAMIVVAIVLRRYSTRTSE